VIRAPFAGTPDADKQLLVQMGRKVLDGEYIKNPPASVTPQMLRNVGF
jgi:hypothetical protein